MTLFLLFFSIHNLCQLLFGNAHFTCVRPCFLNFFQHRQFCQRFRFSGFVIVYVFCLIRNKYIDANLSFGLPAVGSKPSQIIKIIDGIHIIIIRRVERHTDVVRTEIGIVVRVITGDKNIISPHTSFALSGVIKCDAIRIHKRIIQVFSRIIQIGQRGSLTPLVSKFYA